MMKNVNIHINKLFLSVFMLLPVCTYAQNKYYKNVEKVQMKIAGEIADGNPNVYGIITKAFKAYFVESNLFTELSQDELRVVIDSLTREKDSLDKEIKNLHSASKKQDEMNQKNRKIENMRKEIESIDSQIATIESDLRKQKDTLDMIKKNRGVLEEREGEVKALVENISRRKGECSKLNLLGDSTAIKNIDACLESYRGKKGLVERIYDAKKKKTEEIVKDINIIASYSMLYHDMQNAISQMGESFNADKNKALVDSINKHRENLNLSSTQTKACNDIIDALNEQEETKKEIVKFLDKVLKDQVTIPDPEAFEDLMKYLNEDDNKLSLSEYYIRFHNVLKELNVKEKIINKDFTKFIDGLKRQL